MGITVSEVRTNPAATTVELERGRFARYRGGGRWETYLESRRGVRTPDGPLMTPDALCRFSPGSHEYRRAEQIVLAVDRCGRPVAVHPRSASAARATQR